MIVNNKGKLVTPQRSCCYFLIFSFSFSVGLLWMAIPLVCKSGFYADHNENGTLALPLTPSLYLPPFRGVGPMNLNYEKTRNK